MEKANHDKAVITKQFQDSETAISFIKNSFITQKSELETLRKTNADLNFVISQVSPSSASSPSRKRLSAGPGELQFAPPSIRV